MNKRKLKRKRIFILIIVLVIILIILLLIFKSRKKQINNQNTQSLISTPHYYDDKIASTNSVTDVYKGNVPAYKISYKVEMVFEIFLPDVYQYINGKTESELLAYYELEKDRIKLCTGINSSDEFLKFVNLAMKVECDFSEYTSVTYQVGSYQKIGNEESIKLKVSYKNGKELNAIMYINSLSLDKIDARFELE